MNLKRWFAWMCLVLVLVTEVLLFQSYRERDALLTQLRAGQIQLRQTRVELNVLKSADVGLEAAEISRLGKINGILTNKVATLVAAIQPLYQASQSNAQNLATARLALQLQQDHLQRLQLENDQIVDASTTIIAQKTCINNLRHIDDAKQEWAKENNAAPSAVPTQKDLLPYLRNNVFPACPDGGVYSVNAVDEVPTCSIPSHSLP